MAFFPWIFSLFVDILWAASISYGAAMVAQQFAKRPKQRVPSLGSYPIQYSQKGVCIPKIYGCERVAGNVIWFGERSHYEKKTHQAHVDGHVRVITYKASFAIGICEGVGTIKRIWMGKVLIWAEDGSGTNINNDTATVTVGTAPDTEPGAAPPGNRITVSSGKGTQDARWYTGEDFGAYKDLVWAHFKRWELGPVDRIPNFTFEVGSEVSGYKYTYISENGTIWGIPVNNTSLLNLDAGGAAVNVGGGIVGIPIAGHPFIAGDVVRMAGTTNYSAGNYTLTSGTTSTQIQFTGVYVAETFAGDETIMKTIASLGSGSGRMVQDAGGNLYNSHNWSAGNSTYVTKIAPDGTRTYDDLTAPAWPINADAASTATDIAISADGLYLWVVIGYTSGATTKHWLEMYDLTDGSNVWSVNAEFGNCYAIAVDADNNCYALESSTGLLGFEVAKFEPVAGARSDFTDAGGQYACDVNDSLGVVLSAGWETGVASDLYNLYVNPLDNTGGAKLAVGGTYLSGVWNTYIIANNGAFVHDNGYVYVICNTPTCTLYKIKIDYTGTAITGLTVETEVAGPTEGVGIYLDRWGNIAVIVQSNGGTEDDLIWYYDTDLNYIMKIEGLFTALQTWHTAVGYGWAKGSVEAYPFGVSGCADENPATIIEDLSENGRYGAGISAQYIDTPALSTQRAYWAGQDQLISLALTEQMPLMDWVDFILSHCNGFRFWSEGKLHLGAFKNEASIKSLTQDDFIRDEGEDPAPPVQIVKRRYTERSNRVDIQWTDRSNTYDLASSMAKDNVDQRVSGKVLIKGVDLTGIHNTTYAQNQAYRMLFDAMYRFSTYSFKTGYKNMLLQVGDVIDLTDGHLLTTERCRIVAREEDKDGRYISIEAVEDVADLYPEWLYVSQPNLATPKDQVGSDDLADGALAYREDPYLPRLYLYFAPGGSNTGGAYVYRSYDDSNYEFIGRVVIDKDTPANSTGDLTAVNMANATTVLHRPNEWFTVDIGTHASLRTDVSDAEFFANQSLCKVGNEIIAFKTAVDQGSGIWKISNLIRCIHGSTGAAHAAGATFATVSLVDVSYDISEEPVGTKLYFKALASSDIASQTLTDVAATTIIVASEFARPYPMSLQRIEDYEGFQMIPAYPVNVKFNLPSKSAGYNLGGYGIIPWGHFVKDTRITSVSVHVDKMDGTNMQELLFDLDGYQYGDYYLTLEDSARNGNNPIVVSLAAVTALPSTKRNEMIIEVIT